MVSCFFFKKRQQQQQQPLNNVIQVKIFFELNQFKVHALLVVHKGNNPPFLTYIPQNICLNYRQVEAI